MMIFGRIIIFSFLCLLSSSGNAQQHPYLFYTKQKVDKLNHGIQTDSLISQNWKSIRKEADLALTVADGKSKTEQLALAWLVTRDKRYAEKVRDVLLKLTSMKTWSNPEMMKRVPAWTSDLKTAENCWIVSIGYDAIYDVLTPTERKIIVNGLVRMGIRPALEEWLFPETRIHTLNSMGHNWWSACVGMAGVASMAVMKEEPKAAGWVSQISEGFKEWFGFNGDDLQFKPKTMDTDGGMYESYNYASFGTGEYLFFRLAFANTWPDKPQAEIKGIELMANWFIQASYPRTGKIYSLNFGDSDISVSADRSVKLLEALGYKNPNHLWYLKQSANNENREGLSLSSPIGLLYQPDLSLVPTEPKLPTGALFKDMDWAMLRSSWKKDETMLGIKSGYTWNHSHADANSYILFHKGVPIIKDAGNSSYSTKEYPAYFFQSEAHNVVMFNGNAQPKEQQYNGSPLRGQLEKMINGQGFKYVLANGVGPTAVNFSRNFRNFLWIGKVILIIDDVRAHQTGTFSWLIHPGGVAKKIGGDLEITQGSSSVLVRPLFPETLVETGYDHDFPEKMKLNAITAPKARDPLNPNEVYYQVQYPTEVKQTKFITAVILKDSVEDKNIPKIERLHNETMNGVRITQNGKVTEVYLNLLADGHIMHLNSVNNFSGWDTDAYLMGITYPENEKYPGPKNVSDYFIAYGSYLRKDGLSLFSSLSKLYMTSSIKLGHLDMVIQGQPLMNVNFYSEKKPTVFNLNGKMAKPIFEHNNLFIKIVE